MSEQCPTRKIAFSSQREAKQLLRETTSGRNKLSRKHGQIYPYRCEHCGFWHLSSASKVEMKRARKRRKAS